MWKGRPGGRPFCCNAPFVANSPIFGSFVEKGALFGGGAGVARPPNQKELPAGSSNVHGGGSRIPVPLRGPDPSLAGSVGRNAAQAPPAPSLDAFPPHRFESYFLVPLRGPRTKKSSQLGAHAFLAEEVGFEPTEPCGSTVFKTAAFNHSAIPPVFKGATRPLGLSHATQDSI